MQNQNIIIYFRSNDYSSSSFLSSKTKIFSASSFSSFSFSLSFSSFILIYKLYAYLENIIARKQIIHSNIRITCYNFFMIKKSEKIDKIMQKYS